MLSMQATTPITCSCDLLHMNMYETGADVWWGYQHTTGTPARSFNIQLTANCIAAVVAKQEAGQQTCLIIACDQFVKYSCSSCAI
jgi:hypothetical protein